MNLGSTSYAALLVAAFLAADVAATSKAADHATFSMESAGAQIGIGATSTTKDIYQAEALVNWSLPSDWDLGNGWRSWARLDASAGWLGDPDHGGFTTSLGPTIVLSPPSIPLTLEAGTAPSLITEWEFRNKDLGSPFQIATHLGLNLEIGQSLRLFYRFQHLSNGGLSSPNPGLNLHCIGFSLVL